MKCPAIRGQITHTIMPNEKNKKGGRALTIIKDKQDDFIDVYVEAIFVKKEVWHINELADPNRCSPFKADFDFRYFQLIGTEPERRYTLLMLQDVVKEFYNELSEWLVLPIEEDQSLCFIFERDSALYKDKNTGLIKDGVHFVWPYIVCPFSLQHKIREKMIIRLKELDIFHSMQLENSMEDVYDENVIEGSWMMYGSCKPNHKPYELTHILQYTVNEDDEEDTDIVDIDIDREQYTPKYLVKALSMRNRTMPLTLLQSHKYEEIYKIEEHIKKMKQDKMVKKIAFRETDAEKSEKELEIICALIDILDISRAVDYSKWIQLGWCLHNIHSKDDILLNKYIEFSKKSKKHKDMAEEACRKCWDEANNEGLSEGTLHMWAKQDNHKEYVKVLRQTVWGKVKHCATSEFFNPYEIAEITYDMYKNDYVCVDPGKNAWYKFRDGRWHLLKQPVCLKKNLSTEVFDCFSQRPQEYMPNTDEIDPKKWRQLVTNATKLRQTTFKTNVIKECLQFFTDEEDIFLENLDEKRNLIAFNNGVLDLDDDNLLLRDGRPDDYITMNTKINYNDGYSWNHELVKEIDELIEKILPNPNIREYVYKLVASCLHGSVKAEKYWFWTGSGGNGKGTLVTLINLAFGEYSGEMPIQVLTSGRQKPGEASPEVVRLKGVRAVFSQEPEQGKPMNASILKQFSGGDEVTGRMLYGNSVTFVPQWKMITCCNDLPPLPGDDGGVWRRVVVVHFGQRFVDNPTGENEHKKDDTLKDKFALYAEPFMWILIQKFKEYKKTGLVEPPEIKEFTREYHEEMDRFHEFINTNIIRVDSKKECIIDKDAYACYKEWMEENHSDSPTKNLTDFRKDMNKRLNKKTKKVGKQHKWFGFLLKKVYIDRGFTDFDDENSEEQEDNEDIKDNKANENNKDNKDNKANEENEENEDNITEKEDDNKLVNSTKTIMDEFNNVSNNIIQNTANKTGEMNEIDEEYINDIKNEPNTSEKSSKKRPKKSAKKTKTSKSNKKKTKKSSK